MTPPPFDFGIELDRLEALTAAVEEGTFEGAARRLHVTPSAISQRLKALETSVGQVLLSRSKPVHPTASGEAFLRAARQIRTVLDDTARQLSPDASRGPTVVSLAVNADSLETWLLPALAGIRDEAAFDLRREDQDRTADLLRDGSVMGAVTASSEPVPGCRVEVLGRMRYRPCASRDFVSQWFAGGPTAEQLGRAPVCVFDRGDDLQDDYLRRQSIETGDPPRHYVPGSGAFVRAVRLGLGWGMVPELQDAGDGELVDFDPDGSIDVELYWQQWRVASTAVERVASAIRAAARDALL